MKDKIQLSLVTTAQGMQGGADALQGIGEDYLITFGSSYNGLSFNVGDLLTILLTDQGTGYQTQIGAGYVTGIGFNFCMTFNNKVYGLNAGNVYCSAVGQPTIWNDPNALGNGEVTLSNWYAGSENLVSMAPFQGKLVFFSRNSCQVWGIDPNIDNWQLLQVLQNVGTIAPLSVQGLGELDVLFLNDSGVRSLRVRYADLNATSNDTGSPVDEFVQTALLQLTDAQKALCCSIVEPSQNRYWCFIPNAALTGGYVYVLSYFPQNKIIAWSRYSCVDSAGNGFIPQKFVVFAGQVYCRSSNEFYTYGGNDNNTYDTTQAIMQIPFYDEKRPGHEKYAKAVDVDVDGTWEVYGSPDWINNTWQDVGSAGQATFDNGMVQYEDKGSHFSFKLVSSASASAATVAGILFHYELAETP